MDLKDSMTKIRHGDNADWIEAETWIRIERPRKETISVMERWLNQFCKGRVESRIEKTWWNSTYYFEDSADAMLFKLVWM